MSKYYKYNDIITNIKKSNIQNPRFIKLVEEAIKKDSDIKYHDRQLLMTYLYAKK